MVLYLSINTDNKKKSSFFSRSSYCTPKNGALFSKVVSFGEVDAVWMPTTNKHVSIGKHARKNAKREGSKEAGM